MEEAAKQRWTKLFPLSSPTYRTKGPSLLLQLIAYQHFRHKRKKVTKDSCILENEDTSQLVHVYIFPRCCACVTEVFLSGSKINNNRILVHFVTKTFSPLDCSSHCFLRTIDDKAAGGHLQ